MTVAALTNKFRFGLYIVELRTPAMPFESEAYVAVKLRSLSRQWVERFCAASGAIQPWQKTRIESTHFNTSKLPGTNYTNMKI